jgi:hypothetical protein
METAAQRVLGDKSMPAHAADEEQQRAECCKNHLQGR